MIKYHLILLIGLSVFNQKKAFSQDINVYRICIDSAENAYDNGDYLDAGLIYNRAFISLHGAMGTDLYNAAKAWAHTTKIDSSFKYLFKLAKPGMTAFTNYDYLKNDPDFSTLYDYPRWDSLLNMVKENYAYANETLNEELVEELADIRADDQEIRGVKELLDSIFADNPTQLSKMEKEMQIKDSVNLAKVEQIIEEYNWPGSNIIGHNGCTTIFLVIQHASPAIRKKYLPKFRQAVEDGKAYKSNLAMLEDRVLRDQGKSQIYGTQMEINEITGEWQIAPIEDPDNLDSRRVAMGLFSMAEYVKHWDLEWNVEEHKKRVNK